MGAPAMVDWKLIDTVLLDMDGTLLDLNFDNWFWLTLIPQRYGLAQGMSEAQARAHLEPLFRRVAYTLPWYCIDHWSRELALDIRALKHETRERIGFLPGAEAFLAELKRRGPRVVLVTNAHPETLAIKDAQVSVTRYVDASYSTHPFGVPKEHPHFWGRFNERERFVPSRTLFIDDNLDVLRSARLHGIAHLRAVSRPDSAQPPRSTADFAAVESVADLFA